MTGAIQFVAQYFASPPRLVLSIGEVNKILDPPEPRQIDPIIISEANNTTSLRRINSTVHQSSKQFVTLPHTASNNWSDLCPLLLAFIIGSFFFQIVLFFVPLSSVNDGLEANRGFQYGVMSYFQFLCLIAWIESCNYAMPNARIPIKSRVAAVAIGMVTQVLFCALVSEMFVHKVFPIPFSTLVSGLAAVIVAIPVLIHMTPNLQEHWPQWTFCIFTLLKIVISIFVAALWTATYIILQGSLWQNVIGFLFVPLQQFCKNVLVAPSVVKLNQTRYVVFLLVVDMIFVRFQGATLQSISGYSSLPALIIPSVLSILFRIYSGGDRLGLIGGSLLSKVANGDGTGISIIENKLGSKGISQIGLDMIGCTCSAVHEMSLQVHLSKRTTFEDSVLYQDWSVNDITSSGSNKSNDTVNEDEESDASIQEDVFIKQIEEGRTSFLGNIDEIEEEENNEATEQVSQTYTEDDMEIGMTTNINSRSNKVEEDVEMGMIVTATLHDDQDTEATTIEDAESESSNADFTEIDETIVHAVEDMPASSLSMDPPEYVDQLASSGDDEHGKELEETVWEQRQLYHIVESVGSEVLTTIILMHNQLAILLIRMLPIKEHLNETYNVSTEQWRIGLTYGWVQVAVNLIIIAILGGVCFRHLEKMGDRRLQMSSVISYIFRDNFWFLFLWLTATGALSCSTYIAHFGDDFTLAFDWLKCEENMVWPRCLPY